MDKHISLMLQGNNGSVPDPWFTAYELAFYQNDRAFLKVVRGRAEQVILFEAEQTFDRARLEALMAGITEEHPSGPSEVGGPERSFCFHRKGVLEKYGIYPSDTAANRLFEAFLRLFDDDLPDKLETYLTP